MKRAAKKSARPSKPRRQTEIPGTERKRDEDLEAAAEELRRIRAKRMELQKDEAEAADELGDMLRARKLTEYVYEDDDGEKRSAKIVHGKDRVSVRKVKEPKAAPVADAAE